MRIPTLAQAAADGASATGCVLFALIATDIGTGPLAISGIALLGLSAVVRVAAVASARRQWPRVGGGGAAGRGAGRGTWRRWIHALWLVQCLAFGAGLLLSHSSLGAVAAAATIGVLVGVASAALAGAAARRAGRGSGFVDSASITAYA